MLHICRGEEKIPLPLYASSMYIPVVGDRDGWQGTRKASRIHTPITGKCSPQRKGERGGGLHGT